MGALQGVKTGSYDRTKVYEGSESGEMCVHTRVNG